MELSRVAVIPLTEYDEMNKRIEELENGLLIIQFGGSMGYQRTIIKTKDEAIAQAFEVAKAKDNIIENHLQTIDKLNATIRQHEYEAELFMKKFSGLFKLLKFFKL